MGPNECETKWQTVKKVNCFNYLGSQVAADGGCKKDVGHRMNDNNNNNDVP